MAAMGDSAPDTDPDARWAGAAATVALAAGPFDRAIGLVENAAGTADAVQRARLCQIRGRIRLLSSGDLPGTLEDLLHCARAVTTHDVALAARMHVDAMVVALWIGQYGEAAQLASRAAELAGDSDDRGTHLLAALTDEVGRLMAGDALAGTELVLT